MTNKKHLIIIAGPTAVGKSSLAYHIASQLGIPIFSADSRQLYKEMSIVTAKPPVEELRSIPHFFVNHISIHELYSVGRYEKEFDQKLVEYYQNNDVAIVVGGTGLYIKAILEGLDEFNDVDSAIKNQLLANYEVQGILYLQELLKLHDPTYYTVVDLHNHRRLIRALEVCLSTGVPYSDFLSKKQDKALNFRPILIGLEIPREELYARIDQRVMEMIDEGLIAEVSNLHQFRGLPSLHTVGCTEVFDYLEGKITKDEAISLIQRNSRRYAKRQMTWFKKFGNWTWFHPNQRDEIMEHIKQVIV